MSYLKQTSRDSQRIEFASTLCSSCQRDEDCPPTVSEHQNMYISCQPTEYLGKADKASYIGKRVYLSSVKFSTEPHGNLQSPSKPAGPMGPQPDGQTPGRVLLEDQITILLINRTISANALLLLHFCRHTIRIINLTYRCTV